MTCIHLQLSSLSVRRGLSGPHDSGSYNSHTWETGFFVSQGGSWDSEYGRFFLSWYSGLLLKHADRLLGAAAAAVRGTGRPARAKREPLQVGPMSSCSSRRFSTTRCLQHALFRGRARRACVLCCGRTSAQTCCDVSHTPALKGEIQCHTHQ